jgi:pseudouridine-5'-phosphate glycosidase
VSLWPFIDCSSEVQAALGRGAPLVALETTIVTHGMPYPQNVATARKVESIVRDGGAVPATIAVIGGRIRVGLSDEELEWLGTAKDVLKVSRADLPFAVATGRDGATTVAGTMMCAALAGVSVFATGGIGGVHRGAESSMDVSADLEELARTPVVVVCAGAKALLDLPKTLEVLETRGVAVVGYRTNEFPAFWSRSSGLPAPLQLDSVDAIASLIRTQRDLGIASGTVIANPIPLENEIPAAEMAEYIDRAIAEAKAAGVVGKAVTPWLLDRMYALTGGKSLTANIALIENNARLAAEIAIALTTLTRTG